MEREKKKKWSGQISQVLVQILLCYVQNIGKQVYTHLTTEFWLRWNSDEKKKCEECVSYYIIHFSVHAFEKHRSEFITDNTFKSFINTFSFGVEREIKAPWVQIWSKEKVMMRDCEKTSSTRECVKVLGPSEPRFTTRLISFLSGSSSNFDHKDSHFRNSTWQAAIDPSWLWLSVLCCGVMVCYVVLWCVVLCCVVEWCDVVWRGINIILLL